MNSMSAEDSEPGCSGVATPPLTRLEIGLWVCDVLIRRVFPIQEAGSQPQYPKKWEGLTLFFKGSLLEELGEKNTSKKIGSL